MTPARRINRPAYVTSVERLIYDDTGLLLDLTRRLDDGELRRVTEWLRAVDLSRVLEFPKI